MKKNVFCILTLLFTAVLFNQPGLCNWWQHKVIKGGSVKYALDIAWVGNRSFIYGGSDANRNGALRHYDVDGKMYWQQVWPNDSVRAVAAPGGLYPAFFAYARLSTRHVGLRYTTNGAWIGKLGGDAGGMTDLMFVDNNLFTGSQHGWINRWEVDPSRIRQRWAYQSAPREIISLAYWVESTREIVHLVADGDNNVDIRRWDGKVTQNAFSGGHSGRINGIAVGHPRNTQNIVIATVGEDKKIVIWNYKGHRLFDLPQGAHINAVDIDGKRSLLATGGDDFFLTLWTINSNYTFSFKHTFFVGARIRVIKFSPDGHHLAVGTSDGIYIFKTNAVH